MTAMTTREPVFFTIGDVARAANVANETVRRYEREGLITPARTPGGQRIFTAADMSAVQELRAQRAANARHPGDAAA